MHNKLHGKDVTALKKRFNDARKHAAIKHFDYEVCGPKGNVEEVKCKMCTAVLVGLVVDDRFTTTERRGAQTFVKEKLVQVQTAAYETATFEMSDGTAHETPVCKSCKMKLRSDLAMANAVYATDLNRFWELDTPDALGRRRMDWKAALTLNVIKVT